MAGENLRTLLERNDYYAELAVMHKNKMASLSFLLFRNTIKTLMIKEYTICSEEADTHPGAVYHKAIRAFWTGHHERSHHFIEQIFYGTASGNRNEKIQAMLYYGINPYIIKKRRGRLKTKQISRSALQILEAAECHSKYNFCNKVSVTST